jgi:hypothetical protein
MTPASDPYRTLGLARGASLEDVKRAYRALAKKHHPDAAGPTALPRWLAIQAAYEQLVHGTNPARSRATPPRPSAADADRTDATHRAYGGRPRRTRTTTGGAGTSGRSGGATRPGTRPGPTGSSASSGSSGTGAGKTASGEPPRGGKGRNKATLGSTSYDGADAGPFEPDWGGASWYGTTSGTYWTINPKEYADPRKHGPEYQARARRAAAGRRAAAEDGATPGDPASADASAAPDGSAEPNVADGPTPTHTTSSWWRSTAGPAGTPPEAGPPPDRPTSRPARADRPSAQPSAASSPPPPPDLAAAATDLGRALTDERTARGRWRLVQVIVGWLPIVIGTGWLMGEMTGCGRFAASCDGGLWILTPILAVVAFAALLLSPRLAALAAAGAVAIVVAAVPTTLLLSATGAAASAEARNATLGAVVIIAWVVGLIIGLARQIRPVGVPSDRAGPVS